MTVVQFTVYGSMTVGKYVWINDTVTFVK